MHYVSAMTRPWQRVLLINSGIGNTGMYSATASECRWRAGDDLYNAMCSAVGHVLGKFPNAKVRALLWMQGEWDAERGMSQSTYTGHLQGMIAGFRAQFGADIPVIVGGMKPAWVAADSVNRNPVQLALIDSPNQIHLCGYANPNASPAIGQTGGTDAHYTAAEQRIFADRFWTAFAGL